MNRPKRWSYSALSTWKECPKKYFFSYIEGIPWPESAPMLRGTRLHGLAEQYMKEPAMPVPYDLKKIGRLLSDARDAGGKSEEVWLIDKDWQPVDDPNRAWVKAIVDLHWVEGEVLHVRDHKSGREYPSHRDQLELYAILGMLKYPSVRRAESAAIYIDGGYTGMDGSIIRPMLPSLISKWDTDAKAMESDALFDAKPGSACRWCPYANKQGGPCQDSKAVGM